MVHTQSGDFGLMDGVLEVLDPSTTESELLDGVTQLNMDFLLFEQHSAQALYSQQILPQQFEDARIHQQSNPVPPFAYGQAWTSAQVSGLDYGEPMSYITTTLTSAQAGLVPIEKRPIITMTRMGSAISDTEDVSEPQSPADDATERRRERRRAQNRAAQRAFRARKDETIKESMARLGLLEGELSSLQDANMTLTTAISELKAQIEQLRHENTVLKRRSISEWTNVGKHEVFTGSDTPDNVHGVESQDSSPTIPG